MQRLPKTLETIRAWTILITLTGSIIFFLPITTDFYNINKILLLSIGSIIVLTTIALQFLFDTSIRVTTSPLLTGTLALTVASLLSIFIASQNKIDALMNGFGPLIFINLSILLAFFSNTNKNKLLLKWFFYSGIAIVSLLSIYQQIGFGRTLFSTIPFLQNASWTPFGGSIPLYAILLLIVPLLISELVTEIKRKEDVHIAISCIYLALVLAAITLISRTILTDIQATLPLQAGWAIMLEILKSPKQALFGTGADDFIYAFTSGRPLFLNLTPLWGSRFSTNSSFILHITTIYGLVGSLGLLVFLRGLIPLRKISWTTVSRLGVFFLLCFAPPTVALFTAGVLILLLTALNEEFRTLSFSWNRYPKFISIIIGILIAGVGITSTYFIGRAYAAETIFFHSLQAIEKNNGLEAYNSQVKAIQLNPYSSTYHAAYGQLNLALANNLANQLNQSTTSATTDQTQSINTLIQQAVREGKNAVNLAPHNADYWAGLASIYQTISTSVPGANEWTVASYQNAILLDKTNASLRFNFGSYYLSDQSWDLALEQFQQAVVLKNDYANALYNLAYVYKQKNDLLRSAIALRETQKLIVSSNADWKKVSDQLIELRKQLTPQQLAILDGKQNTNSEATESGTLTQPTPNTGLKDISPSITLPEDASPPAVLP